MAKVEEQVGTRSGELRWAELSLVPDLFPILRHSQFEDLLNRNLADPINGLLRAVKPDGRVQCRIEIAVKPAANQMTRWWRSTRPRRTLLPPTPLLTCFGVSDRSSLESGGSDSCRFR
jgi:hypothetical protein